MAPRAPFPANPEEFDDDARISYDKSIKTYILEDENGEEWEWLPGPAKWSKTMDETLVKQQAEIYKMAGVDDEAPAFDPAQKRKAALQSEPESHKKAKTQDGAAAGTDNGAKAIAMPRQQTAVFVSGLPMDVNTVEVRDCFERYGLIGESADTNEKRVKLYNDKDGNFKGEALIVYWRPESVTIAIDMMDGAMFPRDYGLPSKKVSVAAADPSYKRHKDDTVAQDRGSKPRPSKAKAKAKAEELNSKLADWDDDEPGTMRKTSSKFDKTIVVKKAFTLQKLDDDEDLADDIREDMKEDGSMYGKVKDVTVFDLEDDGVVMVRFDSAEAADAFMRKNNGRLYNGGNILEMSIATGLENFKKKPPKVAKAKFKNKDAEEARRLEEYSKFIEGNASANGNEKS